ncbi:MAG: bifunctional diguanylate cyclase/phosphohydrolase [Thermoleophilia bacterium]
MGLVFPVVVDPFVSWKAGQKIYFQAACLLAGFAVGAFCFYLVKITIYEKNMELVRRKGELEAAKDKFSKLVHDSIVSRNWSVDTHGGEVPTCWELKDCHVGECPAHGRENVRCWLLAGTFCRGEVQGEFAQKLGDCVECEVYQGTVDPNPIREIEENFNSLMWAVKEREDLLAEAKGELEVQFARLEELQQQTEELAVTDALTGVRNHGHFQLTLEAEVARAKRYNHPFSLVMVDLDYFKNINDKFGHQKGDAVLRQVGKLFGDATRDVDYVARYGGEEFVIIMPELGGAEAVAAADRLRGLVKEQISAEVELPQKHVGASFGVADFPQCAGDGNSIISAADSALLFAKRKGRNRVAYFRDLTGTELVDGDLDRLHSRLEGVGLETIAALAEAVDSNDQYTSEQRNQLADIAETMARRLDLNPEKTAALALATKLHDIGKVGVPGSVLGKTEKLSPEEVAQVQQHPAIGQKILREAENVQDLISAILYHHERWDGKGYPEKLKGEEIPLMARIVGIIDSYRAMVSDRPYRKALTTHEAVAELRKGAGTQFDPNLVELFVESISPEQDVSLPEAV